MEIFKTQRFLAFYITSNGPRFQYFKNQVKRVITIHKILCFTKSKNSLLKKVNDYRVATLYTKVTNVYPLRKDEPTLITAMFLK